jgi:hypothetical protein
MYLLALAVLCAGWAYWLAFLCRVGQALGRDGIADGATRTLRSGLGTLACSLLLAFVLGVAVAVLVRLPDLIWFVTPGFAGAAATVAYMGGGFDSLLTFFLTPTGVPFALEYVNFISGLRMFILRRT